MRFLERPWCERLGTPLPIDLGPGILSAAAVAAQEVRQPYAQPPLRPASPREPAPLPEPAAAAPLSQATPVAPVAVAAIEEALALPDPMPEMIEQPARVQTAQDPRVSIEPFQPIASHYEMPQPQAVAPQMRTAEPPPVQQPAAPAAPAPAEPEEPTQAIPEENNPELDRVRQYSRKAKLFDEDEDEEETPRRRPKKTSSRGRRKPAPVEVEDDDVDDEDYPDMF